MLQKEHAAVPDFEPWYAGWQERMKADPVMRWLVDARNQIVKRGDLETRSTAHVLIRSYGAIAVTEFTAPPFVPADVIAADLAEFGMPPLPEAVRNASILVVERRWLTKDLPDRELLDALAHCYGILSVIAAEAHERAGFRFAVCDVSQPDHPLVPTDHLGGRLPCMVTNREQRTAIVSLATGQSLTPYRRRMALDPDKAETVRKRYRLEHPESNPESQPMESSDKGKPIEPMDFARSQIRISKAILEKDKHLIPTAWLKLPDGGWEFHGLQPPEDDADKAAMVYLLEGAIERTGAVAIVHTAEAWVGSEEGLRKGLRASESPDRRESILVTVVTQEGDANALSWIFRRTIFGGVRFESDIDELDARDSPWAQSFLRLWERQRRSN